MKAIWKKLVQLNDYQTIELPINAKILCAKVQYGGPCIWFINPDVHSSSKETKKIRIYATGYECKDIKGKYIDTLMFKEGDLVFHVFEE